MHALVGRGRQRPDHARRGRHPRPSSGIFVATGHPHERGRRRGLVLRVGARISGGSSGTGARSARKLADKMHDAFDRVWDLSDDQNITLRRAALAVRDPPRSRARSQSRGDLSVTLVREAMVTEPRTLDASAIAQ